MTEIIITILFFPVYLLCRWPYFRLSRVGPDTGFYVSNHTIGTGKWRFSKGWNANYAMCSKLLPDAFFNLIYLKWGHRKYGFVWRLLFSVFNYGTAVLVGLVVYHALHQAPAGYAAGLICYGLVSTEPRYGIYYESADQFETLFQTLGLLIILLDPLSPLMVLTGTGILLFNALVVKLTGLAAAAPFFLGFSIWQPGLIPFFILQIILFAAGYIGLMLASGQNPIKLIVTELRHQSYYGEKQESYLSLLKGIARQFARKMLMIKYQMFSSFYIPLMAFLGLVWVIQQPLSNLHFLLSLYFSGLLLQQLAGFLPMWWYTIPVLPGIALLAAFGVYDIWLTGPAGWLILAILALAWLATNVTRVWRLDMESLHNYVWQKHLRVGLRNMELCRYAPEMEKIIGDHTLLVYGDPSPNAALGKSYDLPFQSAKWYLDGMVPGWQQELHKRMLNNPPDYIFDMLNGYYCDIKAVKDNLSLHYTKVGTWPVDSANFNLYELKEKKTDLYMNVDFESLKVSNPVEKNKSKMEP